MSSQTVYRINLKDGIDGIQAHQEPIPKPGDYEVLIKVRSVALNYRDISIATSTYPLPTKDQVVPITDMVGEVLEVGKFIHGISVGDFVIPPVLDSWLSGPFKGDEDDAFGSTKDGMLREYVVLPGHILVKLAKPIHNFNQWAAIAGTGMTVWSAFYEKTPLKAGDTVLFLGTGGVSITGLVFAKAAGATTIITSSSDEKLEYAKSLGADHTINYKTYPDWGTEVLRVTGGVGVDHVIENGGLGTIEQSLKSVATSGTIYLIGFLSDAGQKQPDVLIPALLKAVVMRAIRAGSKSQLEGAVRFVEKNEIQIPVDKVFGFNREEVLAAFKYVASGKHTGKVCISLN